MKNKLKQAHRRAVREITQEELNKLLGETI